MMHRVAAGRCSTQCRHPCHTHSFAAAEIQRFFRGFLGRQRIRRLRAEANERFQEAVHNYAASQIQKSFRGFYSRRYKHDYFARRAYVIGVVQQGEAMRSKLQQHLDEQVSATLAAEEAKAEAAFDKATQNLHHLVSTASIRGVFNPAYARDASEVPSAFNIPMETHLKRGSKRFLRTRGLRTASAFRDGEGRGPRSYVGSVLPGGLNPGEVKRTLRCSTAYGEEEAARRTEARHSRLRHLAPRAFTAGGTRGSTVRHVKSIHSQEPYTAPGQAAIPDRVRDHTAEHIARRTGTAYGQAAWRSSTVKRGGLFEDHALKSLPSTAAASVASTARLLRSKGRAATTATPLVEASMRATRGGMGHLLPAVSVRDLAASAQQAAPSRQSAAAASKAEFAQRRSTPLQSHGAASLLRKEVTKAEVASLKWAQLHPLASRGRSAPPDQRSRVGLRSR